jgi:hypothetical protein
VTQVLEALRVTFAENRMPVAHLKLSLSGPTTQLKASLTQLGTPLLWDLEGHDAATNMAEVILNVRVNTTPDKLRGSIEQVISDVCQQMHISFEYTHFECFSPLPPEPTYHISLHEL